MEKVCKCGIKKEAGYLYFVDKEGDVSRAKMGRGRRKKEETTGDPIPESTSNPIPEAD